MTENMDDKFSNNTDFMDIMYKTTLDSIDEMIKDTGEKIEKAKSISNPDRRRKVSEILDKQLTLLQEALGLVKQMVDIMKKSSENTLALKNVKKEYDDFLLEDGKSE